MPLLVYVVESVLFVAFPVWNTADSEEVPDPKLGNGFRSLTYETGIAFLVDETQSLVGSTSTPMPSMDLAMSTRPA